MKDVVKIALGIVLAVVILGILTPVLALVGNFLLLGFLKLGSIIHH